MHVVANIDRIATPGPAPEDYEIKIHFASGHATKDWRVNRECPRYLPNLQIARGICKRSGGGVIRSVEREGLANTAADVLGADNVLAVTGNLDMPWVIDAFRALPGW